MSPNLRKYAHHLKVMSKASPTMCKAMIKAGDMGLVKCLCECALNILKGNVAVGSTQKSKLARHKKDLRRLANKSVSLVKKKRTLQKGGFIGAIISALAPAVLSSLFS